MRISDWSSDVCSSDLQDLLDVGEECDLVHRTVERHRGGDAAQAQGADEGGGLPVAVRDRSTAAFASERPTVHPRHLGRGSRLIDEDQPLRVEMGLGLEPSFRSEEHTSELQSPMRISYAVFCLKKK